MSKRKIYLTLVRYRTDLDILNYFEFLDQNDLNEMTQSNKSDHEEDNEEEEEEDNNYENHEDNEEEEEEDYKEDIEEEDIQEDINPELKQQTEKYDSIINQLSRFISKKELEDFKASVNSEEISEKIKRAEALLKENDLTRIENLLNTKRKDNIKAINEVKGIPIQEQIKSEAIDLDNMFVKQSREQDYSVKPIDEDNEEIHDYLKHFLILPSIGEEDDYIAIKSPENETLFKKELNK